mgnify:CR=1 FL=1
MTDNEGLTLVCDAPERLLINGDIRMIQTGRDYFEDVDGQAQVYTGDIKTEKTSTEAAKKSWKP